MTGLSELLGADDQKPQSPSGTFATKRKTQEPASVATSVFVPKGPEDSAQGFNPG
jgi:hypothetical protein